MDQDYKAIIKSIFNYLKNPMEGIKTMPNWNLKTLILVQFIVSLITGVLSGLLTFKFFAFLQGLIIVPIVSLVTAGVSTLYIYYAFLFLFQQNLPAKDILTIVILSNIPYFIFQTFSSFIPPITLLGFMFSAILLTVGLVERFSFPKKSVMKIVGSLFFIYILIWVWGRVDTFLLTKKM
jgi:hypothetical protein